MESVTDAGVPENDPGVPDGGLVIDMHGNDTGEIVVYEYDEDGTCTGWHKEAAE